MKISELTGEQFRKYFEIRLAENGMRRSGAGFMARCPFHQDRTPSLSLNLEAGVWKCHGGCGQGGLIDFEMKFSSCDKETALARIAEVTGAAQLGFGQKPEAIYSYTDTFGKELFQVVRYPGKRFTQRRPDGKGGWIYETTSLKMVLYHMPEVVTAKNIIVCEGEKDADNLTAALKGSPNLAVTTCPRGAGKWQDQFSVFFAGKQVLILPDNDDAGRSHAEAVARSAFRYAQGTKIVNLPDLPLKGDVSEFLKTKTGIDLLAIAKATPWWYPPADETSLFMSASEFASTASDCVDWLLEGLIQRGANGMMIAPPKTGKSFAVADLALALASGQRWLDFFVPQRVRTALVSREDVAALTQSRIVRLSRQRNLMPSDLDSWLYINAKGLKPKIMLDCPEEVAAMITDLKRYKTEFLILDVMRVLHGAEENDNTEMQKVIDILNSIQAETGAAICLIHHDSKRENASLTERARGASAIAGWAEFICGLKIADHDEWIREFECELKASNAPSRFYFKINDMPGGGVELARTEWQASKTSKRGYREKREEEV